MIRSEYSLRNTMPMDKNISDWPQKKAQVVRAAISVVSKEGLDKTTTARIAKKAQVGEGTIYRYFRNKDELLTTAAVYISDIIFANPRKNYDPTLPVSEQYKRFCIDFFPSARTMIKHHRFMDQFFDSAVGAEHRKAVLLTFERKGDVDPPIFPLNRILRDGLEQGLIKDLPIFTLIGFTLGPLTFILKHEKHGYLELSDAHISLIGQSCWDAIRR